MALWAQQGSWYPAQLPRQGVPKNGILDLDLNYKTNIKQKNYCLCLFESLIIQLSIGRLRFKFKRVSEKLYYI